MVHDAGRDPPRDRRLPPRPRRRARRGPLPDDRLPARRTTRPSGATREIADFFVPHGYAVVPPGHAATATAPRARSEYFHSATPHRARTATTRSSGSPRSPGRTAATARSAAPTPGSRRSGRRSSAPPHLTAIWPDVVPTNTFQHQTREGGAMQLHMFWALYIHAAGRAGHRRTTRRSRRRSGTTCATCASSSGSCRGSAASSRCATCRRSTQTLEDYCTRGAYDECWARKENDFTRFWHEHADIPATMIDRLVRRLPARRHRVLRGDGGEEHVAAAADRRAVEPRRHARRRDLHARRRLRRRHRVWGVRRYFEEQLAFFDRWLKDDATGLRRTRRRCRSSSWAAARAAGRRSASSTTAAAGATSTSGRSRARSRRPFYLARRRLALAAGAGRPAPSRGAFTYDPDASRADDRRPLLRGRRAAAPRARGWSRRGRGSSTRCCCLRNIMTPGPGRPEGVAGVLHRARAVPAALGARRTCSSTRPSRSPSRSR